jgi:hypothetical protein
VRRAAKRDATERAIVTALRLVGWSIEFLSLTDGPDLLLGRFGQTHLAECKTANKPLREGQAQWHDEWRGSPVVILRSVEDALRFHRECEQKTRAKAS